MVRGKKHPFHECQADAGYPRSKHFLVAGGAGGKRIVFLFTIIGLISIGLAARCQRLSGATT